MAVALWTYHPALYRVGIMMGMSHGMLGWGALLPGWVFLWAWQLRSLSSVGNIYLSAVGWSGLLGSRWLSWIRPINIATVDEQRVLIAAGRHLAASVVGEQRKGEFGLTFPFRRMLV